MKYAIISDVHGNISALTAILDDAAKINIDTFIFAGDYCAYLHYPNEIVDIIKNLNNVIAIQGNEEGYFCEYANHDKRTWTDGQFQALYWCYNSIDSDNHRYLSELPKSITFKDGDAKITVIHSSKDVYGNIELKEFSSSRVADKYQKNPNYSREELLRDLREFMHKSLEFQSAVESLAEDIYIFGHSHVQWYAQYKNKTFINPGSCGLPLDGISGAPYTVLDIDKNQTHIEERRVLYDRDKLLAEFKNSSLFHVAPVWSSIILQEMVTQYESASFFLRFVNDYANKINDPIRPYSLETWTEAHRLWLDVTCRAF
jgi:predicted phosphodiesterase